MPLSLPSGARGRAALACALVAASVAAPVALLPRAARAAAASPPPGATLRAFGCQTGLRAAERQIAVRAVMPQRDAGDGLALRVTLLRRRPGGRYAPVPDRDLTRWVTPSDPTLGQRGNDVWILDISVAKLRVPARYKLRVALRWTDAHGRALATVTKTTRACGQPDLRPDVEILAPVKILTSTRSSLVTYVVRIRNRGRTDAGTFTVSLTNAGQTLTRSLAGLAAGATSTLRFRAPACNSADPPRLVADPDHQVDDADRANNSLTVACA